MARYSILIKNGNVFDGLGNPPFSASIGINGNKIEKIGNLENDTGDIEIDAGGKYVAPGFIDLASHSDTHWTIFTSPGQESLVRQGITTIMGGSCGLSPAPIVGTKGLEGLRKWADDSQMNVNWQTMGEFLKALERNGIGLNFGAFVGYATLRQAVVGSDTREATEEEMGGMKLLLTQSFKDGAFGFSTNLGLYQKRFLRGTEIVELMKIVAKNNALSKHHLEDEGKNILPAISRLVQIARESKAKLHISHFKAIGRTAWNIFPQAIDILRRAGEEGVGISCDFFPYDTTGSALYMLLPVWAREMSKEKLMEALKNKESKERKDLISYFKDLTLHYDRITIASASETFNFVGKTIEQIQKSTEMPIEELILNILELNNLQVSVFNKAILEDNIKLLAKEDFAAIGSDGVGYDIGRETKTGLPHPRSFGSYPKAFNLLVKDSNIIPWEKAIYKMSGLPAKIVGLKDRGFLEKGKYADIVVFDPDKIKDTADTSAPYKFAEGVEHVLINGIPAILDSQKTENLPGMVLRKK